MRNAVVGRFRLQLVAWLSVLFAVALLAACGNGIVGTPGGSSASSNASSSTPAPVQTGPAGDCGNLAPVGTWQNVTPTSLVDFSGIGVSSVYVDPNNPARIFVSAQNRGLLRSDDCGANWVHVNTGTLRDAIDGGILAPVFRPDNTNVIYTGSLRGTNGLFKSTNGGQDWVSLFPSAFADQVPFGGFVDAIIMDPANPQHLLVTWHAVCNDPNSVKVLNGVAFCYGETPDGGATWVLRNGLSSWQGGEGSWLQILDDDVWVFGSGADGIHRSTDQGVTWRRVSTNGDAYASQLSRLDRGRFFLGATNGVIATTDNGVTWSLLPGSGRLIRGLVGDGTRIWASEAFPYAPADRPAPAQRYGTASIRTPTAWSRFPAPQFSSGGQTMALDTNRRILYSANYWDGIWRVVVVN